MKILGFTITKGDPQKEIELLRQVAKDNYNRMYNLEDDIQREKEKCEYYQKLYNINRDNYAKLRDEYDKVVQELAEYKMAYSRKK